MPKFLLAIDIGNTTISLGILKGSRVFKSHKILTSLTVEGRPAVLSLALKKIKKEFPSIEAVVICSVVPSALIIVSSAVKKYFSFSPFVVGKDIQVPIKNNYRNSKQVGQDRLVCAYAVKCLYGFPAIVIDFGTATTFDVVSAKGAYEGGIIVPGLRLSAESLFVKTAMLPRLEKFKAPSSLIGKDTKGSILSGLFYGYGAMSRGLIDLLLEKIKGNPRVIVTGGYTALMKKFISRKIDHTDNDLVFKGMALLYSLLVSSRRTMKGN